MAFIQLLTGIPKPDAIKELDGPELLEGFAEGLFDHPYWLQDLSHLPLFAVLAWLWSWYFGGPRPEAWYVPAAAWISYLFATANELIQVIVPQRFPTAGDLLMNLAGVTFGLWLHLRLCRLRAEQKPK